MFNKTRKYMIGEKEYEFLVTNRTVIKVDETYGSFAKVAHGIMSGDKFFSNSVKLMVCSCTKELTADEIIDNCSQEQFQNTAELVKDIYFDYIGVNTEAVTEEIIKNEKSQPSKITE